MKKTTLIVLIAVAFLTLKMTAQDNVAELKLDRYESLKEGVLSKNNGFWVVTNHMVTKYAPSLEKKEWSVKLPVGIQSSVTVYNCLNPKYVYYTNIIPSLKFKAPPARVCQISPTGKVTEKEQIKDDIFKMHLSSFCNATQYVEVWTKKKSDDYVLVKYDNETMKRTQIIVTMPNAKVVKDFSIWLL